MRLAFLLCLYQAATRIASVAYFCRAMLGIMMQGDGARVEQGEWWYAEELTPWGVS